MEAIWSAVKIFKKLLPLFLLAALPLAGCAAEGGSSSLWLASADALPTEEPVQEYTVKFYARGQEVESGVYAQWSSLVCPEAPEVEGMRFLYWADASGNLARPELSPVMGDAEYTAVYAPLLEQQAPYLFVDSAGLLRPDAALDNTELVVALNALASGEAKAHFPALPETGGSVTAGALREVLGYFFAPDMLDIALASHEDTALITRAQFAVVMNLLLGRGESGPVEVQEGQLIIPDVQPSRSDFAALMEAAVPHGHDENGLSWTELSFSPVYAGGFVLIDGGLYCVGEDGYFISDTIIGSLTFGYDGRHTSGDTVLDGYVRGVLQDLVFAHPGAGREELLRAAYEHVRDSFGYLRKNTYAVGAVGWQIPDAISMFECGQGNCYGYAAAFWALARGLGYEAEALSGAIGKDKQPHAWVEISMDGVSYIFDPETEAECLREGGTVRDMFMLHPELAANWQYYRG